MNHILLFVFLICVHSSVQQNKMKKNVCIKFRDYPPKEENPRCFYNPDINSTTPDIILNHGYTLESHEVTTEDGYILQVFRIPNGKKDEDCDAESRQPVFLQHGAFGDSSMWVQAGSRSLAFVLADKGYDVWLGNSRGNSYSRNHVTMNADEDQLYWKFSLHEMGVNDVDASINYIANETEMAGDIIYIGYSQGTTISYIYAIEKKENAEKNLAAILSFAPVVYLDNVPNLKYLKYLYSVITGTVRAAGLRAFGQRAEVNARNLFNLCERTSVQLSLCYKVLQKIMGKDIGRELRPIDMPMFYNYVMNTEPVRPLHHLFQILSTGMFRKYDYGTYKNLHRYGQDDPPAYELWQIEVPVYLYYGAADILSYEPNVKRLYNELSVKDKSIREISNENKTVVFNHYAFVIGRSLGTLLYPKLLLDMDKFSPKIR